MDADPLPSDASVVVIGGGIMGCSTLYHLTRLGVTDTILLERSRLTAGTTWHSAAQVRQLRSSRNLTRLIQYSASLYADLEAETGQATGWLRTGSLSIATNPDRLVHIRRQASLAHAFGVAAETITAAAAAERWPLMRSEDITGAVWSPDDGRVNPSDLCAALIKGARGRGGRVFEHTAVTGIGTREGCVSRIDTDRGSIRCDAVALCAGLWSREIAEMAGVRAPLLPCEHFYLLTRPVAGAEAHLPTLSDHDGRLYIRDEVGGLLVGCFEPRGKAIDPALLGRDSAFQLLPEDWEHFEPMMLNALHRLPALETAEIRMLLNGPESFTPDGLFMLGEAAETSGLFLGCGMNSVGIASGGGAGMALAHCVAHGHAPFDLDEADPKRFHASFNSLPALSARAPEVLGSHYEIAYPARQFASARRLRTSPLEDLWRTERARFGQFYGWERPLYFDCGSEPQPTFGRPDWFTQVGEEVAQAHSGAALFDLSTFGKIRVTGPDAERFLQRVCCNDMGRPSGCVVYTAMLNPRGGYQSDLTAQRLGDETYRLFVGTASIARDLAWLRRNLEPGERVRLHDESESLALLGLMGPGASGIVGRLGADELLGLRYFRHGRSEIAGAKVHAARLSYVGESGWEITCPAADALSVATRMLEAGARPAGLFAQTAMRIEKRYLALGHELGADMSPIRAGLEFAVDWRKDFIGKTALLERRDAGESPGIIAIAMDDTDVTLLGNEPVYRNGEHVGETTSAGFGYRVGRPVAIAVLNEPDARQLDGATVQVDLGGSPYAGRASLAPLFDPTGERMRSPAE